MRHGMKALAFAAFLFTPLLLQAAPVIDGASVTIDKPDYWATYAIGIRAYVTSEVPVTSVTVVHTPVSGGSAGQWALAGSGGYEWWNWSPNYRPMYSEGHLDGTFAITATDELGATSIVKELAVPVDAELELPTAQVNRTALGYEVSAQPVARADYYNLWLWDPVDRFYPSSQQVTDPATFVPIPTANLVSGRTYNLYFMAVHQLDVGQFRSYTLKYISHASPEALLQQLAASVFGVGPGKSLPSKVELAQTYFKAGDIPATCAVLTDFVSTVSGFAAGKKPKLSPEVASQLTTNAHAIMAAIGCD